MLHDLTEDEYNVALSVEGLAQHLGSPSDRDKHSRLVFGELMRLHLRYTILSDGEHLATSSENFAGLLMMSTQYLPT